MCSNPIDIEDLSKLSRNTDMVDPDKLNTFMTDLVNKGSNFKTRESLRKLYRELRCEYRINPSKKQMRVHFYKNFKDTETSQMFRRYLVKKAMRSQSGVLVVTITLSPNKFSCKYDCSYCPQETDRQGNHTQPRSYMSSEPAMRRALRHKFDVRGQFWDF